MLRLRAKNFSRLDAAPITLPTGAMVLEVCDTKTVQHGAYWAYYRIIIEVTSKLISKSGSSLYLIHKNIYFIIINLTLSSCFAAAGEYEATHSRNTLKSNLDDVVSICGIHKTFQILLSFRSNPGVQSSK